jgi:hypothetical protein
VAAALLSTTINIMPAHPYAALMAGYAKDALTTEEPHELWEFSVNKQQWNSCTTTPSWNPTIQYRRKPRYILINGYEVPAPERKAPKYGTTYYTAIALTSEIQNYSWDGLDFDNFLLHAGLVHLTEEAAKIHARALLSFTALPVVLESI